MGWLELEESQVAPHNMSDTIAECIANLANQRKDLWTTRETWGEVCERVFQTYIVSIHFVRMLCSEVIMLAEGGVSCPGKTPRFDYQG